MPDFFDLNERGNLSAYEGKTLEFKRDLSSPANPLRTLVAFANTAGAVWLLVSMTTVPSSASLTPSPKRNA